jgi:hypothetical protein
MTGSDVISIAGVVIAAAALIPQVIQWIYKAIRKPTLEILSARVVSLTYTSSGPFLQIALSISSQHGDVIVTKVTVLVRHQSQEERMLEWTSATEPLMNIPIPTGESLSFNKPQSVLAIKAIKETLTERILVFGDLRFMASAQEKINSAREHFNYLSGEAKEPAEEIVHSKEFQQAERFLTDGVFWREGAYRLEFNVFGRQLKKPHQEVLGVTLAGRDVGGIFKPI